eukprot:1535612-Pyramimonas_sp.AAC.1
MAGWSAAVLDPAVSATACPSGGESAHVSTVATEKKRLASSGGAVYNCHVALPGGGQGARSVFVRSAAHGALVKGGCRGGVSDPLEYLASRIVHFYVGEGRALRLLSLLLLPGSTAARRCRGQAW